MNIKALLTPDNKKKIKDLSLSIGAILVLNVVIQFVLYPFLQRRLGNDGYGVALTLLALVSITANTVGSAANYSRMVKDRVLSPSNGDYNLLVLLGGLLSGAIGVLYLWQLGLLNLISGTVFVLLILATAYRYYSDVDFKLSGNTVRYFLFYVAISAGYLAGLLVYHFTDNWMTSILTGEVCGILFTLLAGTVYRTRLRLSAALPTVCKSMLFLLFSGLFENLTLNADRLILLAFSGGEAVSIYYTASLFGKVAALLTVPLNAVIITYLVRYDKGLTRKMWSVFAGAGVAFAGLAFGACVLGSYILLPFLYPGLFELTRPYMLAAIAAQICYFISGVLLVVLLRFRGEKKQFYFNLGYGVEFFALVILGTVKWGLDGFVWSSLIANALRLAAVLVWGFLPDREKKAELEDE